MEVMSLAERQGVLAIAFDGVQYFDKLSNHNCMPDIDSLMEWLGQASYNEVVYEEYEKTVAHLSKLFGDQSLRAIVMKDYGCSLNYPKPNHRPCGDIDIYVANHKGKHDRVLVDFANQILVNAGAEDISHGNEHHSRPYHREPLVYTGYKHSQVQSLFGWIVGEVGWRASFGERGKRYNCMFAICQIQLHTFASTHGE